MSETKGLYQLPDEPEPPPLQGSVSAPVASMGRADAPLKECAHCGGEAELLDDFNARGDKLMYFVDCDLCGAKTSKTVFPPDAIEAWNRRDGEAARIAEAKAAAVLEREREIVTAIAGLPTYNDHTGRVMISWFDVQMILRGIELEAPTAAVGDPSRE
jgi:Lar family restriction alleviation protein